MRATRHERVDGGVEARLRRDVQRREPGLRDARGAHSQRDRADEARHAHTKYSRHTHRERKSRADESKATQNHCPSLAHRVGNVHVGARVEQRVEEQRLKGVICLEARCIASRTPSDTGHTRA